MGYVIITVHRKEGTVETPGRIYKLVTYSEKEEHKEDYNNITQGTSFTGCSFLLYLAAHESVQFPQNTPMTVQIL